MPIRLTAPIRQIGGAVKYDEAQTLTSVQQSQARDNINAMDKYNGLTPVECAFSASSVKTFYAKGTFIFPDYTASDFVTMMHFQLLLTGTANATFEQNHIAAIMPFVEKGMFGNDFWEVATLNNPIIIQDAPIAPWITLKFYVSNAENKKVGVKISTSNGYVFENAYSINNSAFDNSITYNDIYLQTNTSNSAKDPTLSQLEMAAEPTKDMQIATKKYVDDAIKAALAQQ